MRKFLLSAVVLLAVGVGLGALAATGTDTKALAGSGVPRIRISLPVPRLTCPGLQGDISDDFRPYFVGVTPPSKSDDLLVGRLQREITSGVCPISTEAGPVTSGTYVGGTLLYISVLDTAEGRTTAYRAFLRHVESLLETNRRAFARTATCAAADTRPCRTLLQKLPT
jgi:hypothetical protein